MKNRLKITITAAILLGFSTVASATPVPVTLVADDFSNLLGGSASAIGSPTITSMTGGNLIVNVVSQAFTDGVGNYVYLYQVNNTGAASNSVVEVFTTASFFGATGSTTIGYLNANAPTGFTLGAQTPFASSIDAIAGPTISFAFPAFLAGLAIDPGESSSTLYVLSSFAPGMIVGNVINGELAFGDVVGAIIPEPASVGILLVLAGGMVLRRRS